MTLEEVFQFVEAKEAGKRSAGRLLETQGGDATRSLYRRGKHEDLKNNKIHNKNDTCSYCGNDAMAKISPLKQERMIAPHMVRLVPTAVVPTPSRLYAAARPSQTLSFLPHQMPLPEKMGMLLLTPSALPLVSARPETDVRYT